MKLNALLARMVKHQQWDADGQKVPILVNKSSFKTWVHHVDAVSKSLNLKVVFFNFPVGRWLSGSGSCQNQLWLKPSNSYRNYLPNLQAWSNIESWFLGNRPLFNRHGGPPKRSAGKMEAAGTPASYYNDRFRNQNGINYFYSYHHSSQVTRFMLSIPHVLDTSRPCPTLSSWICIYIYISLVTTGTRQSHLQLSLPRVVGFPLGT